MYHVNMIKLRHQSQNAMLTLQDEVLPSNRKKKAHLRNFADKKNIFQTEIDASNLLDTEESKMMSLMSSMEDTKGNRTKSLPKMKTPR
jgi:hypothetical protein